MQITDTLFWGRCQATFFHKLAIRRCCRDERWVSPDERKQHFDSVAAFACRRIAI